MATKKISIFYSITQTSVLAPQSSEIIRKDEWIKEMQKTVKADWEPKIIRVTYEIYDPEVENMMKFFNGPVVEYYAIQNREELKGEVDTQTRNMVRESLLDECLGFDVQLLNGKTKRDREKTADFKDTQKWYEFLETLRETQFEPNGYEFPNSKKFWENDGKYGYTQAKRIAIEGLLKRIQAKLSTPEST